jgi:hypothetical protein
MGALSQIFPEVSRRWSARISPLERFLFSVCDHDFQQVSPDEATVRQPVSREGSGGVPARRQGRHHFTCQAPGLKEQFQSELDIARKTG